MNIRLLARALSLLLALVTVPALAAPVGFPGAVTTAAHDAAADYTGGTNVATALLNVGGIPSLYTVDPATGAAAPRGTVGNGGFNDISALAGADVPSLASLMLLAAGLGLCLFFGLFGGGRLVRRPAR